MKTVLISLCLVLAISFSESKSYKEIFETEFRSLVASGIKTIEEVVQDLQREVEKANPQTEFGKQALKSLDDLLTKVDETLDDELKRFEVQTESPVVVGKKEALLRSGRLLRAKAVDSIRYLKSQGRSADATELELLESTVFDAEQRLEKIVPKTQFDEIILLANEEELQKAENKLSDALKNIKL